VLWFGQGLKCVREDSVTLSAKNKEGLRPACLPQVRICEPGAPLKLRSEKAAFSVVVSAQLLSRRRKAASEEKLSEGLRPAC
jgi:hypothetical protein